MARATPPTTAAHTLTFVGTATTILRLGPFTLLTDPNFLRRGQYAYLGYGLASRRLTDPATRIAHLPPLDAVVLSHLHGDHFDRVARRELDRHLPVLTTPAAARTLRRRGFREASGMATWESWSTSRGGWALTVTSVPGVHGPGPLGRLLPPVMGTVLELSRDGGHELRVYVTGDTVVRGWLREVTERTGPIDTMVVHLGGTRILGVAVTMTANDGADLAALVGPGVSVPIHLDDYTVFRTGPREVVNAWRRRGAPGELRMVGRGRTVPLVPARTVVG